MKKPNIKIPAPIQQADFAFQLKRCRALYLQDALLETVNSLDVPAIDKELAQHAKRQDLSILAKHGLRGELLFPVPCVLKENPRLLGYYRLLLGFSQKEFYGSDKGFGVGAFRNMEAAGKLSAGCEAALTELCNQLCLSASDLLQQIGALQLSREFFDHLTLLTLGPQFRGGANNQVGAAGIIEIFTIISDIVGHAVRIAGEGNIEIESATGRTVRIELAPDPDIVVREQMSSGEYRNVLAIEVKAGKDISNIHNRIGEAEKSHQKARQDSYTECWTVVNVSKLDPAKAKTQSPSTDRFYSLIELAERSGERYEDFRDRILSLTSVASVKRSAE